MQKHYGGTERVDSHILESAAKAKSYVLVHGRWRIVSSVSHQFLAFAISLSIVTGQFFVTSRLGKAYIGTFSICLGLQSNPTPQLHATYTASEANKKRHRRE